MCFVRLKALVTKSSSPIDRGEIQVRAKAQPL